MKNTTLAGIVAGTIAGGLLAVNVLDAAAPDVRSVIQTARSSIAASLPIHCEIPCGIYDDHAEVARMRLDAATMKKASAQIVALSKADAPKAVDSNLVHKSALYIVVNLRKLYALKLLLAIHYLNLYVNILTFGFCAIFLTQFFSVF